MNINQPSGMKPDYSKISAYLTPAGDLYASRNAAFSSGFLEYETGVRATPLKTDVLEPRDVERACKHVASKSRIPEGDTLKLALSVYGGLRALEISKLTVENMLETSDRLGKIIRVPPAIAKGGYEREVPMHPRIAEALARFRLRHPGANLIAVSPNGGSELAPPQAVLKWFQNLYRQIGHKNCSGDLGRRTFIASLGRVAHVYNCSLRDVLQLAGLKSPRATEGELGSPGNLVKLVRSMGPPDPLPLPLAKVHRS